MQDSKDIKINRCGKVDAVRFVCSILVVYFHTCFPGNVGYALTAISRVAVPLFFMVSGFFYMNLSSGKKIQHKLRSTGILVLIGSIIYLMLWIFSQMLAGRDIAAMLRQQLSFENIWNMIFWNQPLFGEHLWFLLSYLNIILILPVLKYKKLKNYFVYLFVGNLILGTYAPLLWGRSFEIFINRNWIFTGIPFVCLGMIIYEKKDDLLRLKCVKHIWMGILLSMICSICEAAFLRKNYGDPTGDVYISTIFFAVFVFLYSINEGSGNNKRLHVLSFIGRKYTLWIYMLHPLVATLFDKISGVVLKTQFVYTKFIIVYTITLLLAIVIEKITKLSSLCSKRKQSCKPL